MKCLLFLLHLWAFPSFRKSKYDFWFSEFSNLLITPNNAPNSIIAHTGATLNSYVLLVANTIVVRVQSQLHVPTVMKITGQTSTNVWHGLKKQSFLNLSVRNFCLSLMPTENFHLNLMSKPMLRLQEVFIKLQQKSYKKFSNKKYNCSENNN